MKGEKPRPEGPWLFFYATYGTFGRYVLCEEEGDD